MAFQEVHSEPGVLYLKAGTADDRKEVRGMERQSNCSQKQIRQLGIIKRRQVANNAMAVTVPTASGDVGYIKMHLPACFTLNKTGAEVEEWTSMYALREARLVILGDFSEIFVRRKEEHRLTGLCCCSGWWNKGWNGSPPTTGQHTVLPPLQTQRQPRRLDYIFIGAIPRPAEGECGH